jgi:DNA-binding CsgD family transcriptional regulator
LAAVLPGDSAILVPRPLDASGPVALNRDPSHRRIYRRLLVDAPRLTAGMEKGATAAARGRDAYLDTEVFSLAERNHLPFYAEVVRPQNISSQIVSWVSFRRNCSALLFVCRHGRATPFGARHTDVMRLFLPAIGVALAAVTGPPASLVERLSPREREMVALVAQGGRNHDVSLALGISANTVRNSIARIFKKLGVISRAEMAALAAIHPGSWDAWHALTPRERQIAGQVARGLRNRDIAAFLGTSANTVRNQLASIFEKLELSSRAELAVSARASADR